MCETSGGEKWSLLSDISAVQFFVPGVPMSSLVKFARLEKCSEFFLWPNDILPTTSPPPPSAMLMVVAAGGGDLPHLPQCLLIWLVAMICSHHFNALLSFFFFFLCVVNTHKRCDCGQTGWSDTMRKTGVKFEISFSKMINPYSFYQKLILYSFFELQKKIYFQHKSILNEG